MKTPIIVAVLLILVAAAFVWYDISSKNSDQVVTPNGQATTTPQTPSATYINASSDNITVDTPAPGAVLGSEFTVSGQARGTWYFEASFPVKVLGSNNQVLVQLPAQATSDWMTENFVPFSVVVKVPNYSGPATLVLEKDNPSGEAKFDASVSIPIMIASTTAQ